MSDFPDIPQQLVFLGYTVFGKIVDSSHGYCVFEGRGLTRQTDMKTVYVICYRFVPKDAVET
jgi:hypothetical protein